MISTTSAFLPTSRVPMSDRPRAAARSAIGRTVEHLRSALGEEAWAKGMNPDVPETHILDNPYTYTEYHSGTTHGQ